MTNFAGKFIGKFRSMFLSPLKHPSHDEHHKQIPPGNPGDDKWTEGKWRDTLDVKPH